jgi:hypothetical protein
VWAVGAWYRPISTPGTLIEHWNGTSWRVVPSPNVTEGYNELYGIAAVSSTDVWAVGYHNIAAYGSEKTMALHWNGSRWSVVPTRNIGPNANFLFGVSAVASDDVWAVGLGASTSNEVGRPLIQHWDGARWSLVPNPNPGDGFAMLKGVVALAADDVWTVGTHDGSTLIEHWDGSTWTVVPSPNPGPTYDALLSVAGFSGGDVWAAGQAHVDTLVIRTSDR